jgi:magnesium transporter
MIESKPFDMRIACWQKGQTKGQRSATLEETEGAHFCWIDVTSHDHATTAPFLIEKFGFHELEVEDALTEGERPHLHENETHLFFTAPAIRIEQEKIYFSEVGFFISKGRLVTVTTEPVALLETMHTRLCEKTGPPIRDASRLLYLLVDAIVDAYYPVMDMLEDRADELESSVFGGEVVPIKDLLRVKRRLLEIRRRLAPFRDILNGLLRHDITLIAKADVTYFHDIYDHTLRVLEHVDLNRDILASVLEANLATVSNRLNQVMRVLTVASVILMSAALVAGIYGMNFEGMPELHSPWGYPMAIVLMVVIAAVELWIFRKKGWL